MRFFLHLRGDGAKLLKITGQINLFPQRTVAFLDDQRIAEARGDLLQPFAHERRVLRVTKESGIGFGDA